MKNYSILRKNGGLIGDGIRPLLYELEYRDIEAECSSIGAMCRGLTGRLSRLCYLYRIRFLY